MSPDKLIVLGVLHLIGGRWISRTKLIELLVEQFGSHPSCGQWRMNEIYHDCPKLEDEIAVMVLGGAIIGQTASRLIMPAPHVVGAFGQRCLGSLNEETQEQLHQAATLI